MNGIGQNMFSHRRLRSSPTVLSRDTFTGPDGTDLATHVPDFGPHWILSGGFQLLQGQVQSTSGNVILMDLGQTNITIDFDAVGPASPDSFLGAYFRAVDIAHAYVVGYYYSDGALEIYEAGDNGWSLLASSTLQQMAGNYHIKIILQGTSLTVVLSGTQSATLQIDMSDYLTATQAGLFFDVPYTDSFDNWQVTTP